MKFKEAVSLAPQHLLKKLYSPVNKFKINNWLYKDFRESTKGKRMLIWVKIVRIFKLTPKYRARLVTEGKDLKSSNKKYGK